MFSKKFAMSLILYYISPYLFRLINYWVGGFSSNVISVVDNVHDVIGLIMVIYMLVRVYKMREPKTDTTNDAPNY